MAKNNLKLHQQLRLNTLCQAAVLTLSCTMASTTLALTLEDARLSIRTKQFDTAEHQLIELAKTGDSEAQYLLGSLYNSGQGVARNYEKSAFWLTKAAQQNHAKASYTLGLYHETGKGTAKNTFSQIK